ncbi:Dihydrodipicolinate synthase/N-acetylneuraminate lyase [Planctomycetales bacterium 10988]|nr:Dihydrodipicolinate synthase/N-acetylneuraminate lyase [Planctomycetales bacterium 10988]
MKQLSLDGLIAATFTPFHKDGSLHLEAIPSLVEHLISEGVSGLYVLGSTGEGLSLTQDERFQVAEAYVKAAAKRIPVLIHVGSECLSQARSLAIHAAIIEADGISAVSPVYFKPNSLTTLVRSMAEIAAGAPKLPFYYYHIPAITGVSVNLIEFLQRGAEQIPTLQGIKFTSPNVHEFQSCLEFAGDRYDILWGLDEMLLSGLTAGAKAAVGSTYNYAAPIYQRLLAAFEKGDLAAARHFQSQSQAVVRTFVPFGPRAAQKAIMAMIDQDCGPSRLPIASLTASQSLALRKELEVIGFFDWVQERSRRVTNL